MRVCILVAGLHAWGKMSGSGSTTRRLAKALMKRGIEVCAVTPRRSGQNDLEQVDGIKVFGFSKYSYRDQLRAIRNSEADIYHSKDPSFGTWLAMKAAPRSKHLITFLDTRSLKDWLLVLKSDLADKHFRFAASYLYENTPFVTLGVRKADTVVCAAKYMVPLVKSRFKLKGSPKFIANPVEVPGSIPNKSDNPTVVFAGRWIPIKRPELFLKISKQFPDVQFISMGKAENHHRDAQLRHKYGAVANLDLMGWVDQFRSSHFQEIFSKSWILINMDLRGGLPIPFVEAASFGCAILSSINPDGFASKFGYWARMGDFAQGLRFLLNDDKWRYRGEQAYEYVKRFNDINIVADEYIRIYKTLLDRKIR